MDEERRKKLRAPTGPLRRGGDRGFCFHGLYSWVPHIEGLAASASLSAQEAWDLKRVIAKLENDLQAVADAECKLRMAILKNDLQAIADIDKVLFWPLVRLTENVALAVTYVGPEGQAELRTAVNKHLAKARAAIRKRPILEAIVAVRGGSNPPADHPHTVAALILDKVNARLGEWGHESVKVDAVARKIPHSVRNFRVL